MNRRLAMTAALCAIAALIFSAKEAAAACLNALELCGKMIIPALFPFFVLSILLNRLGLPGMLGKVFAPFASRLYGISGAGASALLIGLTGGYPLGAAYIADMERQGSITASEGERLLGFCNNSGPAFIIGAVGAGVFASSKAGVYLYCIHTGAAVLKGLIMRRRGGQAAPCAPTHNSAAEAPFSQALPEAVKQATISIINVCGFAVCFTVLIGLLDADGFFSLAVGRISALTGLELHWVRALLMGLLELSSGAGAMRGLAVSPANLALAAFILGWGGVSVHFQTMALIAGSDIKGALHFAGRLISAVTGAAAAYLMYYIIV